MNLVKILVSALVFVAFVPGVLVTLPPGAGKWTVLAVHGLLFAVLHFAVQKMLLRVL